MKLRYEFLFYALIALALFAGTTKAHAVGRGWQVVHLSTAAGFYTGATCTAPRLKLDATPFGGDSFGVGLTCSTWTLTAPRAEIGYGIHLLSLGVVGKGTYYDCNYLDEDSGPVPYIEVECFGMFNPSDMFGSGFEPD